MWGFEAQLQLTPETHLHSHPGSHADPEDSLTSLFLALVGSCYVLRSKLQVVTNRLIHPLEYFQIKNASPFHNLFKKCQQDYKKPITGKSSKMVSDTFGEKGKVFSVSLKAPHAAGCLFSLLSRQAQLGAVSGRQQ